MVPEKKYFNLPFSEAEFDAARGTGARPVGAAPARDVSVVTLVDLAAGRHSEADGTLQDLLHLGLHQFLPCLCLLQLALQGVESFLQNAIKISYYMSISLFINQPMLYYLHNEMRAK